MTRIRFFALLSCCTFGSTFANAGEIQVDVNFPGGSAKVESIDQEKRVVTLSPTPHQGKGFVCWWYARISGLQTGETLTLDVGNAPWATPDQAVFSHDNQSWQQTKPGVRTGKRIRYEIKVPAAEIWIAWGAPFLLEHAQKAADLAAKHPYVEAVELCQTRGGNPTPALVITEAPESPERIGIWIQARQHAWESGSSWVCNGFVKWVVSDDPAAQKLRKKALITVVPIMDVDNVQIGAGGKNQKPQDHNRDWSDEPHWKAVATAQVAIRDQDKSGNFDLFVDLHNPAAGDKHPFYFIPPKDQLPPIGRRNLETFLATSKEQITGPLSFKGRAIESGPNYDRKAWMYISKNWVATHTRDHAIAVTLETSWNTPESTVPNYEQVGRELGLTISKYFEQDRRTEE